MFDITDQFFPFCITVVITGVVGSSLVYIMKCQSVNNRGWKIFDYIWFLGAALGIFSLCANYDRALSAQVYNNEASFTAKSMHQSIYQSFKLAETQYCSSPNLFNNFQTQSSEQTSFNPNYICKHVQDLLKDFPQQFEKYYPHLLMKKTSSFTPFFFRTPILDQIDFQIDYYEGYLNYIEQLKKRMDILNYFEHIDRIVIAFGFLLGIRLTKVTVELRDICHARKKEKEKVT